MNQIGTSIYSIDQLADAYLKQKQKPAVEGTVSQEGSFQQVLKTKQEEYLYPETSEVVFSKHANERLNSRNIQLTEAQMHRLNEGIEQARGKKIKESLVMLDNLAFVVNINNNTVITALDQKGETSHVFTNIDGAVIV